MRNPSRSYLEDLRGLETVLKRQLAKKAYRVTVDGIASWRTVNKSTRRHWQELLTLCRREIERVEKAVGGPN